MAGNLGYIPVEHTTNSSYFKTYNHERQDLNDTTSGLSPIMNTPVSKSVMSREDPISKSIF